MMISRSKHRSSVDVCADCGASDPSWASINRGLLLCAECCSVHRSMGRHISHVKSLRQGSWPPSLLAMIQTATAQNVNSVWEHYLLDTSASKHLRKKLQPKDPLHPTKSDFIQAKHLRLEYVLHARRDEPPSELGRQLHSAVRSHSLDTAMRLLAQGADPNYYSQEKGNSCLHVACRAGRPAQAELLVAWGADASARDRASLTPADCARQGGHHELAERMIELVYEVSDRLTVFLSGEKPMHSAGEHYAVPRPRNPHEMTDVAKAARGKLQLLPNHLFEELVMDIYDEVDRRETEAIWQTSALGLERCGVAFLPVNPALSAPRNQARQKLARLAGAELAALLRDVLRDAARRQHVASLRPQGLSVAGFREISQVSDDEPLYDSVADDDDYAALAPLDIHLLNVMPKNGDTVSSLYNPSLPIELSSMEETKNAQTNIPTSTSHTHIETLRKELDNRDSTISELKNQLKNLQTIVEQLTKENSELKTSVDDTQSITSQNSTSLNLSTTSNGVASEGKLQERGKSMETDHLIQSSEEAAELRQSLRSQRPVSMFETREGPKNNWQVTKHQLTPELDSEAPPAQAVHSRAEAVTRAIQELWASARDPPPSSSHSSHPSHSPSFASSASSVPATRNVRRAVADLLMLFPEEGCAPLAPALREVRAAAEEVCAWRAAAALHELRAAAYRLAKATKLLLTHFALPS